MKEIMSCEKMRNDLRIKAKKQFSTIEARERISISRGCSKFKITNKETNEVIYKGHNQTECSRILKVSPTTVRKWVLNINKSKKYRIDIINNDNSFLNLRDYKTLTKKEVIVYLQKMLRDDYIQGMKDIISQELLPEIKKIEKLPWV